MSKKEETTSEDSKTENKESTQEETQEVNYEAELAKLQEQISEKNGALKSERERRKQAEKLLNMENDDEPQTDIPDDKIEKIVDKAMGKYEKMRVQEDIEATLESMTDNEAERKLIRQHYENTLNPTGFSKAQIKRDLENAQLLANRQKFQANAQKKAKKAVAEKQAVKHVSGTPSGRSDSDTGLSISQADVDYLKRNGWSSEKIKKRFSK